MGTLGHTTAASCDGAQLFADRSGGAGGASNSCGGEHLHRGRERQPEGVRHRAAGYLAILHVKPVAEMRVLFQCPRETLACQGKDERTCRIVERKVEVRGTAPGIFATQ
jgi:hypothetical protein